MARQIADSDYVLVLTSRLYRRRFEGREEKNVGRGAKWEGAIITQELYESEGRNERFIPVVLCESDIPFIPVILAGQTRYNINNVSDYGRLVKRISPKSTGKEKKQQDESGRGLFDNVSGPSRVSNERIEAARFLLQVCEDGLPIEVLAEAVDVTPDVLERAFSDAHPGVIRHADGHWRLDAFSALPEPADATNQLGRALEGLLAFIKRHRDDAKAEGQVRNAVRLAERCWTSRPKIVAPLFSVVDKLIKRKGDKRQVLHAADLSIKAARHASLRTNEEAKAEARALVCGRAWVLQRLERLKEAAVAIENALELGKDIGCSEIVAYATKCLGRLRRMEADEPACDPAHRAELLNESRNLLRGAIDQFERMDGYGPEHRETGDCFCLLGRTEFAAGEIPAAERACRRAIALLTDDMAKEWADLQILLGDITANTDKQAAPIYYDNVLARGDPDDATHSEIKARAHFQRALALKAVGQSASAMKDFAVARSIWKGLQDPLASKAEWAELWASGAVDDQLKKALSKERFAVRVRAAQIHKERLDNKRGYVARRSDLPKPYLEELKKTAREAVAVEEAHWSESVL